jgi:hypothetical protein
MRMDAAGVVQVVEAIGPERAWLLGVYPHPYSRGARAENNSVADLFEKVASFAEGRMGYREWVRRSGRLEYIHSIDDRYDHDINELMA